MKYDELNAKIDEQPVEVAFLRKHYK